MVSTVTPVFATDNMYMYTYMGTCKYMDIYMHSDLMGKFWHDEEHGSNDSSTTKVFQSLGSYVTAMDPSLLIHKMSILIYL